VARVGVQVADALAYAHRQGILHRDIKPANLLLDAAGAVWVTDFGLAKTEEEALTHTGDLVGTIRYMAPERFAGVCDARSDLYALGLTLYELLLLRPAFGASDRLRLLDQVRESAPARPRSVDPRIPRDLETISLKAIAKEARQRYPSADRLAEDLRRFLKGEPTLARPVGALERTAKWARRRPALAALLAVSVLALAALLGGGAWFTLELNAARLDAVDAAQRANSSRALAEKREGEARFNQYVAQMNLVQREYETGNIDQVRALLEVQIPLEPAATDYRSFEWYYWQRMSHRELLTLKGHTSEVHCVAYSPDDRRLASVSDDGTVRVWDAVSGQQLLTLQGHTGWQRGLAYSPDGRRLASAGDRTVHVWDAASGRELLSLNGHEGIVFRLTFNPDGRRLASGSYDGSVRVWDATSGQLLLTVQGHSGPVHGVAFGPDGRRLASAGVDRTVRVWDAASGQLLFSLQGHTRTVGAVAYSRDGQRLASAGHDHTVRVWDAVSDRNLLALQGHTGTPHSVAYSPDGRRLASASYDRTVRVWDAVSGQQLLSLKGHTSEVHCVAYSPDGRRLASASVDSTVRVWDAASGQQLLTLQGHMAPVHGVAYGPDGRRLASAGNDQTVRVWDATSGQQLLCLKGHADQVFGVAYSPDGRQLASVSKDRTVRVWDAATGGQLHCLKGHTDPVTCVAYSPDGRRLASGGVDWTVRVWDVASGQALLTLTGHRFTVWGVAFSPDGRRLASVGDCTVRVWEAASGQQLLALQRGRSGTEAVAFSPDGRRLASGNTDRTVRVWETEPVSAQVWRRRKLVSDVHSLFAELLLREEVADALRKDHTLKEAERTFALQVAQTHSEDPMRLNEAAWKVVRTRDAGKDAYAPAVRRAEAAIRAAPDDGSILNTLGVAQYRLGRYAEALGTLTMSEKLNFKQVGIQPADLAFLALTQHQLGKKDEAKAALGRLRELMKQSRWAKDIEAQGFLREAEELIEGKPAGKKE
jgi:WD40 repeat protein